MYVYHSKPFGSLFTILALVFTLLGTSILALVFSLLGASASPARGGALAPADYTLNSYTLSIGKTGAGSGTVTSSPAGISCGATCSAIFNSGQLITLTPAADPNSTFTGWSGGICVGNGLCTFMLAEPTTVTAEFTLNKYTLAISKTGAGNGIVTNTTSSPGAITCGATCSATFYYGTSITLLASPSAGSLFTGWSGMGCSGTDTCTLTVWKYTLVDANFSQARSYTLAVKKTGTGFGKVTSSPAGITCGPACSSAFSNNKVVTLTPAASPGSYFSGWSGGGCTGTGTCTLTMDAAKTVEARFDLYASKIFLPMLVR